MANFDLKQIIQKQAQREIESFEHNRKWSWGITVGVDYDDSPAVLGMPGYIYVREHSTQVDGRGGLLRVFNNTVPLQVGVMVKIARNPNDPSQRQVIGSDTGDTVHTSWWDGGPGSSGPHHETHEWPDGAPGSDPVSVYKRALVPLRTYPSSSLYAMNVDVAPILYKLNGVPAYYAGDSNFDLSAYAPTATSDTVYALIYLDTADNTLKVTTETYSGGFWEGGLPGSTLAANLPYFPSLPEGGMASAVIIIQGADTTVTESMIYDVRTLFDPPQIPHPIVLDSSSILSIGSGGAVAAISDYHLIASSGLYGSTLDTITPASDYQLLVLQAAPGDTVTVAYGLGNIYLNGGADFILTGDKSLMLFYDGTNWSDVGAGGGSGAVALDDLTDVVITTPADGELLAYDDASGDWVNKTAAEAGLAEEGHAHALDDLSDVDAAAPADGQVLSWDDGNSQWVPVDAANPAGGVSLLFSQVIDQTIADTTDETSLLSAGRGSKALPADALAQGTTIRLALAGHLGDTGAPTLNVKITLGGTEVCSTGAVALNNTVTDSDWHLEVYITCRSAGATGTVVASGMFEHDNDAQFGLVKTTETTIDTTAALALDVTATWGTASASNTITCQEATIEKLSVDGLAPVGPSGLTATEL